MAVKTFVIANVGVTFSNIVKDCKEFKEESQSAFNCVWASVSTAIGVVTLIHQANVLRGSVATWAANNGVHIVGINKREEILSSALGVEVRHIGVWDGIETHERSNFERRDDNSTSTSTTQQRDVFGVNFGGYDFHFSFLGQRDTDGAAMWKLGQGPGPDTPANRLLRSRVKRDNEVAPDPVPPGRFTYGNQYYDTGGLDFVGQSVERADDAVWRWVDPTDHTEFSHLVDTVSCYLSSYTPLSGPAMNAQGIFFQVYNHKEGATVSAGAVAPFSATSASVIDRMGVLGGLSVDGRCQAFMPGEN